MMDDADDIIVNTLLKQYNVKALIKESVFKLTPSSLVFLFKFFHNIDKNCICILDLHLA